jgi:phosphoesterase RecJ-like protein
MRLPYREAVEAICSAKRIMLAAHVNPDGDTLGCVLALTHALRMLGKDVMPFSAHGVPDIYDWMPGIELLQTTSDRRDFDLAIICDAGALNRIGSDVQLVAVSAPSMINIDHHLSDSPFGDVQIVDARAAATAELVYHLLRSLQAACHKQLLTKDAAVCLMTGIITDTGSFRFLNVTPHTFALAAHLQRLGADPAPIAEQVFENRSYAALQLLGLAITGMKVSADGQIAWAAISYDDFQRIGAVDADTEGIVSNIRSIKGVQLGMLFREVKPGSVRVSLRSREGCDVTRIARVFGGGGHKLASGCSLNESLSEAVSTVVAEAVRQVGHQA